MYSKYMYSRGLSQAYEMQDFAHAAAMALRDNLKIVDGSSGELKVKAPDKEQASIIAQMGKVWSDAQERIRIHKGKPLPGSLSHEKIKRQRVQRSLGASVLDNLPSAADVADADASVSSDASDAQA